MTSLSKLLGRINISMRTQFSEMDVITADSVLQPTALKKSLNGHIRVIHGVPIVPRIEVADNCPQTKSSNKRADSKLSKSVKVEANRSDDSNDSISQSCLAEEIQATDLNRFKCLVCTLSLESLWHLKEHLADKHVIKKKSKELVCSMCAKMFVKKDRCAQHLLYVHHKVSRKESISKKSISKESISKESISKESNSEELSSKELNSKELSSNESNSKKSNSKELNSKESSSKELNSKELNSKKSNSKELSSKKSNSKKSNSKELSSKESNSKKSNSKESNSKKSNSKELNSKEVEQ